MPKNVNASCVGSYFITLSLNLPSASLVTTAVITLLQNDYNIFVGRYPLEKLSDHELKKLAVILKNLENTTNDKLDKLFNLTN